MMLSGRILEWILMSKRCVFFSRVSCCIHTLGTWRDTNPRGLVSLIISFVYFELTIFIADTYSYQLRRNGCLNHFLVHSRYVSFLPGLPTFFMFMVFAMVFWHHSSIVAFVGIISNIYTVCKTAVFLAWICKLPKEVVGIISVCLFAISTYINDLKAKVAIGYFTTCVARSVNDAASDHSPSPGALWGYTSIHRVGTVSNDAVLHFPSFRKWRSHLRPGKYLTIVY